MIDQLVSCWLAVLVLIFLIQLFAWILGLKEMNGGSFEVNLIELIVTSLNVWNIFPGFRFLMNVSCLSISLLVFSCCKTFIWNSKLSEIIDLERKMTIMACSCMHKTFFILFIDFVFSVWLIYVWFQAHKHRRSLSKDYVSTNIVWPTLFLRSVNELLKTV